MTVRTLTLLGTTTVTAMMLAQGCHVTEQNPGHCNNNEGDEYCNREFGDGTTVLYCEQGTVGCRTSEYGCVEQRPADACYSPCGGRSTIDENGECVMMDDSSTSSSSSEGTETEPSTGSSSESSSTTGPMPCGSNDECNDVTAPYCDTSGVCVPCDQAPMPTDGDAACATANPKEPVCFGGTCVQCTPENTTACTGTTPVCDEASNTCVACTAHDQCGEAACNLYTGACLPGDAVVHVGGATPDFPNLTMAVASFAGDGAQGTIIAHDGDFNESLTVDTNRVIAFLAADDAAMPPRWVRTSGDMPQLTVSAGSTVLMDGIQVSGNSSSMTPALRVTGGFAWLDRCRIVQNTGGGILAEAGAELTLRNCFVGGGNQDVDAIALDASSLDMLYTTAGGGGVLGGRARALYCSGDTTANVRNSILVSADPMPEVECTGVVLTDSATEADAGTLNVMWFAGYATGDFHLSAMGAPVFADIAQWSTGDPPTDIDGASRPTDDASPDYAGADVPSM